MEQKTDELKKNFDQRFEAQSEMIKSVVRDVCALLVENFKLIFKEEMKKEIDERVISEKHMLQQQITSLKQVNLQIQNDFEELEQYGRRLSLSIDGVPVKEKERSQDVFEYVVGMFEEAGAGNVDGYIDRAHRIGKTYFDKKSSKNCKSIIVKLATFRHRTIVYRLKKNMKDNIKVHVDLTEKRCNLLKSGSNLVNDVDRILFCYADINCRLKIKLKDEPREDDFFTSIDDLEGHVDLFIYLFIYFFFNVDNYRTNTVYNKK